MPEAARAETLAGTQPRVLLVRLTVAAGVEVRYGEVVDPETRRTEPFRGLAGMPGAVAAVLAATSGTADRPHAADRPHDEETRRAAGSRPGAGRRPSRREPEDPCLPS